MFREVASLIASNEINEDSLTATAAYLLRKQFVFRGQPGDQAHYQIIDKHFLHFENAFAFFGARLVRDMDAAFIGFIPTKMLSNLKLIETALLLTLRLIYDEEKLSGMTDTADGAVLVPGDRLIGEYRRNTGRDDLGKTMSFNEALRPLRQKSIIRMGDKNYDTDVEDVYILPSIEAVIDKHYALNLIKALESVDADAAADANNIEDEEGLIHEAD